MDAGVTSSLRARVAIVAERCGAGTRLATLRSDPPVALRPAGGAVYLAASAAWPVGGDAVHLDLTVGPGAELEVRSVAAALALPGAAPGWSAITTTACVGRGGELRWLVEPTVLVRGCDHRADTRIDLAPGAALVWREEMVLGRTDEPGGSIVQRLRVDRDARPLLRSEHAVGPRWAGSTGPAGAGGHRALGMLTVVGAGAAYVAVPPPGGPALMARADLDGDAVVVSALAPTARALREALDEVVRHVAAYRLA